MKLFEAIRILLRGVGQVMFQNNALTGFLFLIGIAINSYMMFLGAVLGVAVSTGAAFLFKYKKKDISNGLYGFNGTLVGIALFYFQAINPLLILFVILASALSTIFMNLIHENKIPPFTFPFVLSTWLFLLAIKYFNLVPNQSYTAQISNQINFLSSITMGFGQVMFQAGIATGIIFFVAILINSQKSAIYAFLGAVIGTLLAFILSQPITFINLGLFGYNAVLCAIAFSEEKKLAWLFALISVILSIAILFGMNSLAIIALTAPFVFASWIVIGAKKLIASYF